MTPTDPGGDVSVRLATVDDAEALADLYSDARRAAVPQMPPAMHTDEEHRGYYARQFAQAETTVWVAESDAGPLVWAICTPTFLEDVSGRCTSTREPRRSDRNSSSALVSPEPFGTRICGGIDGAEP